MGGGSHRADDKGTAKSRPERAGLEENITMRMSASTADQQRAA